MKNMKKQGKKHFSGKGLSIKQKVTLWYACMLVLIVLLLFGFIFSISRSLLQRESECAYSHLRGSGFCGGYSVP